MLDLDRDHEPIAAAGNVFDESWFPAVIAELSSQHRHGAKQRLIRLRPAAPDFVDQLILAYDAAARGREFQQKVHDQRFDVFVARLAAKNASLRKHSPGP